jgi:hypothetical protein
MTKHRLVYPLTEEEIIRVRAVPKGGCQMRPPTERDQCQTKLAVLIEGFMRADWTACRDAAAWLRDFADQENIERGRVMCGRYWFTPQQTKVMRERVPQQYASLGKVWLECAGRA